MHEQDGDGEPAHHARRPMNAFLIFCKRHRSVVRAKYPNLENRSITKILGEWWANLDEEEKACYTDLAKQYKDAFFSANPDFKWYKLPAPPLRTLSSRPREPTDKHLESSNNVYHQEVEKTNNNSTKYDFNKKSIDNESEADVKPVSMFTPGKLADEAQMGGLSSLLAIKTEIQTPNPYYSPPTFKFNPNSTSIEYRSHNLIDRPKSIREHSINELQNALSETTKMFEEDFDEKEGLYHYVANDQFTNQDVIDQIVDKRYYKDEEGYQRNWSDDEKNRSDRTCKGKRYQEFMAVGGLIVNKRQRRDCPERLSDEGYNASCSCDPGSSREESTVFDDSKNCFMDMAAEIEIKTEQNDAPEPDNNGNKTFKAADFDLEAKIEALPSLSLEKYQERKREGKRKKKSALEKPKRTELNQRESSNHRESSHQRQSFNQTESTNQIINSVPCRMSDERRDLAERWRNNVIGSQKRKPRKISITRIETNSRGISSATNCHPALSSTVTANCIASNSANTTNCLAVTNASNGTMKGENKRSPEFKIATEAPCTVAQSMEACQASHSVDLLALATLAEVASNTSKIEDTTDVTAKASEDNASKV